MSAYLTSDDIIESVKRRASIPEAQNTFTPQDFLDLANEEMAMGLVPTILQFHEEYLVKSEDTALVSGQVRYPIPYRAIGNKLRDLCYVDSSGNEFEMIKIDQDNTYDYRPNNDLVFRYKVEGGDIVILVNENAILTGSLRFRYHLRPSSLVLLNRGAQISSIDRNTGIILFTDEVPSHFTTSILFDLNRTKPDHRIISFDITATAVGASSITFDTDDIPDDLEAGDYICQSGETVIPNIPTDLHVMLAHRVATRCLESLGDTQGLQNANVKLAEMEVKTGTLIDARVESSPMKIVNRHGLVRAGRRNFWRSRW